jgi:DNA-damage-inducible protein D
MKNTLAIFEDFKIRRIYDEEKEMWYFSVVDIIAALIQQKDFQTARKYWNKLKERLNKEGSEVVTKCHQLKLQAEDGKMRLTNVANPETLLRLIQSVPSSKAEPFKLWLAQVGYERIQEIENPELATKRTRELYKAKGYSDAWIEKRMRGIEVRATLTDAWQKHGVKENKEYEILTAEISKAAFGMTPTQYKKLKGLKRENLRDHMNDLELIFSMLSEAATTEITNVEHPQGLHENKKVSKRGGNVAKEARVKLEKETGKKVINKTNYLLNKQLDHN